MYLQLLIKFSLVTDWLFTKRSKHIPLYWWITITLLQYILSHLDLNFISYSFHFQFFILHTYNLFAIIFKINFFHIFINLISYFQNYLCTLLLSSEYIEWEVESGRDRYHFKPWWLLWLQTCSCQCLSLAYCCLFNEW